MDTALSALRDFRDARFKAQVQSVLAKLSGESNELLNYDDVRSKLKGVESSARHLEDIPVASIVGSVGRYNDFNRSFLPLRDSERDRWVGVKRAMTSLAGVPPIEVYRIGDAYFIKDGNHRVSVARQQGFKYIEAYVTDVATAVPLGPGVQPDDLILKEEFANFLEKTDLHKLRPETATDAALRVTAPGGYDKLLEHISLHRYYRGQAEDNEIAYPAAVAHWFDTVFLPTTRLIEERGLLEDFPERTPADLYLWLGDIQKDLEYELGWSLPSTSVATGLSETFRPKPREQSARDANPVTYLADDLLVAVPGTETGWKALEQAFNIARREGARIYGLHVVPSEKQARSDAVLEVRREFRRRCENAGLPGQLAVEVGEVGPLIAERARWFDVVVATLAHPPRSTLELSEGLAGSFGLNKGFQTLLRRTPRPVLAVPRAITPLTQALLAYDGSARADIALFAATYLAARWQLPLSVVCVQERAKVGEQTLKRARTYLERHGVGASYLLLAGGVADVILATLSEEEADLLLVGGYSYSPVLEPLLGGVLDDLLRRSTIPLLICQ